MRPFRPRSASYGGAASMVFSELKKTKMSKFVLRLIMISPFLTGLGGCASQIPVLDRFYANSDPLITNSLTTVPSPFEKVMTREEWRLAEPSLDNALNPANLDTPMAWKGPDGEFRGSFRPTGTAFTLEGQLCRDFAASFQKTRDGFQLISATACRFGAGPWQVRAPRLG
jgi:hypothetical protein